MAYIDPWSGFQAGSQSLAEAAKMSRQAQLDAMAQEDWQFKKAERERNLADLMQEREALRQAAKPIVTTVDVVNPEYGKYQQSLAEAMGPAVPQSDIDRWKAKVADMPFATRAPHMAEEYGGTKEIQNQIGDWERANQSLAYAQRSVGAEPAQTLKETKTTAPSVWKQQIEAGKYLMSQGNPLGQNLFQSATKGAYEEATKMLALGDGPQAVNLINEATGSNLKYIGTKDGIQFIKGADDREYAYDPVTDKQLIAQGATFEQRLQGAFRPVGEKARAQWVRMPDDVKDGQTFIVQKNLLTGEEKHTKVSREPNVSNIRMEMPVPVIDTKNDNSATFATRNQINAEPGRYLPSTGGATQKALDKQNLMSDIRDNVKDAKTTLTAMPEFTAAQAAQISLALSHTDSALKSAALMKVNQMLSPEQQAYVIKLNQLTENAMAMRTVLGMGQGSQDVREAIKATLPSAKSPSKAYATKQLDALDVTLNRLQRGIPNVPLREMPAAVPKGATSITGPKGEKGYMLNGKAYTMDGKEIK